MVSRDRRDPIVLQKETRNKQITLEKQRKLFVQGYNLEVHDVIKYHATVIISHASWFYLRDVISRSQKRLLSTLKVRFIPC